MENPGACYNIRKGCFEFLRRLWPQLELKVL